MMTKAEFEALKAKIQENKDKGIDLDKIMAAFADLTDAIKAILPDEVKAILEKYKQSE